MAPPPPSNLPLSQRLMQLAKTLQFAWFAGHVTLLLCTARYFLSYITFNCYSTVAQISYRTAFIAAAATYGIVVYKAYRARMRSGRPQAGGNAALIADENVQYLIMAIVWLFSRQVPLALLPFSVYSVFHVATYTRANLIPTIQPPASSSSGSSVPKQSALSDTIGRFVKTYYDTSMELVAVLEIMLWFRLVLSLLTFSRGGLFLFVVYTLFFRARYSQSTFVQDALNKMTARADAIFANQSIPPLARQVWTQFKYIVRQVGDATDIRRFTAAKKTS